MSPIDNNDKNYWRSLDDLNKTPEFIENSHREFPEEASQLDPVSRRNFIKLMSAGFALAGATALPGCRRPEEKIMPYSIAPEDIIPGKPMYYATSYPKSSGSIGLLVKAHEGRPVKIEGLPEHPANKGKVDSDALSSILDLYNPDRLQTTENKSGESIKTAEFNKLLDSVTEFIRDGNDDKVAFLSEPVTSPSLKSAISDFTARYDKLTWHTFESENDDNIKDALNSLYGSKKLQVEYDLKVADIIIDMDSDFLTKSDNNLKLTADFSSKRNIDHITTESVKNSTMSRLYSAESAFSITGGVADERLRIKSSKIQCLTIALAKKLFIEKHLSIPTKQEKALKNILSSYKEQKLDEKAEKFLDLMVDDLLKNKGKSIIFAGKKHSVATHLTCFLINIALSNFNKTFKISESTKESSQLTSLEKLVKKLNGGKIEHLFIIGGNPIYNTPSDIDFKTALTKAKNSYHLTYYKNDTSVECSYSIPKAHFLESWGDTRAYDGTISFIQPLIAPLYKGITAAEFFAKISGSSVVKGSAILKKYWSGKLGSSGFARKWRKLIHDSVLPNSSYKIQSTINDSINLDASLKVLANAKSTITDSYEVVFQTDYKIGNGEHVNNGWLQELADPISKNCWDNAALISVSTAKDLKVTKEDVIQVTANSKTIKAPITIIPGYADKTIGLTLGYAQKIVIADEYKNGYDAYSLRTSKNPQFTKADVKKTNEKYLLANIQDHNVMEGRPLFREDTLLNFHEDPEFAVKPDHHLPENISIFEEKSYDVGPQWGMTIDLNTCTACNVCTIACQSENNIPIVGKDVVRTGREMSWIRIDRYFSYKNGNVAEDKIENDEVHMVNQPVNCMHCENAPCETVCPVAATTHSQDGINDMVYNRCIGTRYCQNNCPFKVRRFNFFNYHDEFKEKKYEVKKMIHNPNVTVRFRGVMEKCTFCIQRINEVKINTKNQGKTKIEDGIFTTACAQACPTDAIVFGDILDKESKIYRMKKQSRQYDMLHQLNLKTRVTYLAKVRNSVKNNTKVSNKGGH